MSLKLLQKLINLTKANKKHTKYMVKADKANKIQLGISSLKPNLVKPVSEPPEMMNDLESQCIRTASENFGYSILLSVELAL